MKDENGKRIVDIYVHEDDGMFMMILGAENIKDLVSNQNYVTYQDALDAGIHAVEYLDCSPRTPSDREDDSYVG